MTDVAALLAALPGVSVLTDRDAMSAYRQDWAAASEAGWPLAVVRARCTADVQAVLGWASQHAVPVVTRGAGSGLSGGSTAVDGCIVLSTERMRDITIDPVARVAVTQPGLLNVEVKKAAEAHGLWYPPDPSSFEICSIGGNAATNAGGLCCVKYGVTTDYVLGMEVVSRRRHGRSTRWAKTERRCGIFPDQAFRGFRGRARHHHRIDTSPDPRSPAGIDDGRRLPINRIGGGCGACHHFAGTPGDG